MGLGSRSQGSRTPERIGRTEGTQAFSAFANPQQRRQTHDNSQCGLSSSSRNFHTSIKSPQCLATNSLAGLHWPHIEPHKPNGRLILLVGRVNGLPHLQVFGTSVPPASPTAPNQLLCFKQASASAESLLNRNLGGRARSDPSKRLFLLAK